MRATRGDRYRCRRAPAVPLSPGFPARQEQAKYDQLVRFGELLPAFRERAAHDLEEGPYGRNWACAVAATLINRGWFRVGSERYARTGRTYGITTLAKRHVSVRGNRIRFRYRGKHRVLVRTNVRDAELADAIKALLQYEGGARLLRFERDGALRFRERTPRLVSGRDTELLAEESALLSLLRSWRIRRAQSGQ